ncbi:MAG: hypothetical protein IPM42_08830 [Saprospiraceae bacterium]|nr:hypothetical protein [Saprospiraceae bacterium]
MAYGLRITFLIIFIFGLNILKGQENADTILYPGKDFSLEGALELFKLSSSPEDFESRLNDENSEVNNLDLNEDGDVDYIHVTNKVKGDVHLLILSTYISEKEVQDIAVIQIEKTGSNEAMIQIIGDKDLYEGEVMAEPYEENQEEKTKNDDEVFDRNKKQVVVNVWTWPSITYIYAKGYKPWISPWRYNYYPPVWRPRRPLPFLQHRVRVYKYKSFYSISPVYRIPVAQKMYRPIRRTSVTVVKRNAVIKKSVRTERGGKKRINRSRRN